MTRFTLQSAPQKDVPLAVVVFQGEKGFTWSASAKAFPPEPLKTAKEDGFQGKPGEAFLVRPGRPVERALLLSAGKASEADLQTLRTIAAAAARRAAEAELTSMAFLVPEEFGPVAQAAQAVVEGILLGS